MSGIQSLLPLLSDADEMIIGNISLCLSNCLVVPDALKFLADTDLLKMLLERARDCRNTSARQNCAIFIAKLTQMDEK